MCGEPSWSQRLFAWVLGTVVTKATRRLEPVKQKIFSPPPSGKVLEIGLGAAPNLKYYKDYASQIIGLDPNLATRQYAEKEIENLGLAKDAVTFVQGRAENIPFDDNSIDSIVCTTVLCSVTDPDAVLKECKRVLKPGGKFYFIEHVAAPRNSRLRQVQGAIRPVISFLGEGCNPTRETGDVIKAAGFRHVELDAIDVDFPLPFRPFSPHIFGVCTK